MKTLSTQILNELVAQEGRYLQWEMPYPHGSLKGDYFTVREAIGTTVLVIQSGGREMIEDFLRQGVIVKDSRTSKQGSWAFTATGHAKKRQ